MSLRVGLLSILTAILLVASGLAAEAGTPAWNHHKYEKYVALGDSYAAGQGGGRYLNNCKQTSGGYPALLNIARRIQLVSNASCSGATTTDVLGQLGALNSGTDLVTVTVGGDDLDTSAIAAVCTAAPTSPQCASLIATARGLLTSGVLAKRLATTFGAIAEAAPKAEILVTGYPLLFETPPPANPLAGLIAQVNVATLALNAIISGIVAQIHLSRPNIAYVDVTGLFAGHGVGSTRPWIIATGADALHPNVRGYRAYARAVAATWWKNYCYPRAIA